MKNLVIVESPAKTKKIASFLGDDYVVLSSVGHIRDLPKSQLGVDLEKNFEPQYELSKDKKDVVRELQKQAKISKAIYLAPDLDREGEAIAWHLGHLINDGSPLQSTGAKGTFEIADKIKNEKGEHPNVYRVVFNSITKEEVLQAFKTPRKLNYDLVDAQQARRVLDRLVGYKLSPLLWEKIRYGLSAGRVQSVAVRLVVEREREITGFENNPYFELNADFECSSKRLIKTKLTRIEGNSIYIKKKYDLFAGEYSTEMTSIESEKDATNLLKDIQTQKFQIAEVKEKENKSHPSPPFTTSTLQQSAAGSLGYSPKRTMQLAQKLYEGGFITYMRTDSVHITGAEVVNIRKFVGKEYGKNYLAEHERHFKAKKQAKTQEAHEAIRPTSVMTLPDKLPKSLTDQHRKVYELIWKRTVATQMSPAVYKNTTIYIDNSGQKDTKESIRQYTFEAKGTIQVFDGFTRVYHSGRRDEIVPEVKVGEDADLKQVTMLPNQITPPPRYNESSLVKALESFGIGRPSTYASIIGTIQTRGYVIRKEKNLLPTDNGIVVNDLLVNHFPQVVDVDFTSKMEEGLDEVAAGEEDWRKLIGDFYWPFEKLVLAKKKEIKKEDIVVMEKTDQECPECKEGHLIIKLGKFGKFYSCDRYPDCKYAQPIEDPNAEEDKDEQTQKLEEELKTRKCPECGGVLKVKTGRFGKFIACENYPKCKYTEHIHNKIGVKCPKCGESAGGEIVAKKTKRGRLFYACTKYPTCDFASWTKPNADGSVPEAAPRKRASRKKKTA